MEGNRTCKHKLQSGASAVRKSQGHGQAVAAPEVNHIGGKHAGEDIQDTPESPSATGAPTEGEPLLKEVLQAINSCKFSLCELSDQLKTIREELSFVRHDSQKVCERTTALES